MANTLGGYEEIAPPPPPRTFEIGLVMAGAISAGTYAAGVIDYLIEALDAWEEAKAWTKGTPEASQVPQHQVVIKVVTAASAGSMNGAILAVAAGRKFQHVGLAKPHFSRNYAARCRFAGGCHWDDLPYLAAPVWRSMLKPSESSYFGEKAICLV